jgi:hypothetical protein
MSDRDPNVDWEQPRLEQSRGGAPHYSGTPGRRDDVPLASSGRARNRGLIVPIAIVLVLFVAGLVVLALAR